MRKIILLLAIIIFLMITAGGVAESKGFIASNNAYRLTQDEIKFSGDTSYTMEIIYSRYNINTGHMYLFTNYSSVAEAGMCLDHYNNGSWNYLYLYYGNGTGRLAQSHTRYSTDSTGYNYWAVTMDQINDSIKYLYKSGDYTLYKRVGSNLVITGQYFTIGSGMSNYTGAANNNHFNIVSVRIYKRYMDSTEMQYNSNNLNTVYSTDSLYFWWNGNTSENGDTLYDISGRGNNAYSIGTYVPSPGTGRNHGIK